ncbi:SLAM family member 6 [Manis javanica]|nr:SLAM family member 6 isoform X1 [Manis javanica]KAI5940690.1 SLAM family member 6 [Manis javanica]
MNWLFPPFALVFCLGPGNTVPQTSSTPLMVAGVLGEAVTLPLQLSAGRETEYITWLHNGTSIVFIQVNQVGSPQIMVTDPRRKDRLQVTQSYSLQLSNLMMADTGTYRVQMGTNTSILFSDSTLRIFRRLRNLQIASHPQLYENGTCEIHLTCYVENPNDNVSLRWQASGNTLSSEANLTISRYLKNFSEQNYTCIAENPVSHLSSSVSARSLCKGVLNKNSQYLGTSWIIIMVVVILICLAIFVSLLLWKKISALFHSWTWRPQSSAGTTGSSGYTSFSPGNTVYAQVAHLNRNVDIPTPVKSNDCSTIYSIVYHPKEGNCH